MVYSKNILLTAAGYTANYGGFLASDMYVKIFNNSKMTLLSAAAQAIIRNSPDFDYEGIYSDIDASPGITPGDKLLVRELVVDAYKDLDTDLKRNHNRAGGMRSKFGRTLLQKFIGRSGEKGLWFTLNQDLLEESRSQRKAFGIQDVERLNKAQVLERTDFIRLPNLKEVEKLKARVLGIEEHIGDYRDLHDLNYIKLHGSYGWLSADGSDGMVFGKNKPRDIAREPLLSFYLSLFKKALCRNEVRLLIIGYSFRDELINDVILDAVNNHGLRVVIVGSDALTIRNQLSYHPNTPGATLREELPTKAIWDKRYGHFDKKLIELFEDTHDMTLNTFAKNLIDKLA